MQCRPIGHAPFLRASITFLYFFSNVLLAHATELSFWSQRRITQSPPLPAPALELAAPLKPEIEPELTLEEILARAPGTITNISMRAERQGIVALIQDVHVNAEAQRNIESTIDALSSSGRVGVVGLEAAFGPFDLTVFRRYPNRSILVEVVDYGFRAGLISGAMRAALVRAEPATDYIGVDDRLAYSENVDAYRRAQPLASQALEENLRRFRANADRKTAAFGPALFAFDQRVEAYRAGTLRLGDYVDALSDSDQHAPEARQFLEAVRLERAINVKLAETERSRLLAQLIARLRERERGDLLAECAALRAGRTTQADFYAGLQASCARRGVPLFAFPELEKYIRYTALAGLVNASALNAEIQAMERDGYARLAKTSEEKTIAQRSKYLFLEGKMIRFALTPDEWAEYKALSPMTAASPTPFETFYVQAERRDEAMASVLIQAMQTAGTHSAALVAGGFHSPGLKRRLEEAGFNTITFAPRVSTIEAGSETEHLSALLREKTPLDRLFDGDRLFTAPPPSPPLPTLQLKMAALDILDGTPEGRALLRAGLAHLQEPFEQPSVLRTKSIFHSTP